jgi:hypothetical protein
MNKRMKGILSQVLSGWIMVSLLGCSLAWQPVENRKLSTEEMVPLVSQVVDEQLAIVQPVLQEHEDFSTRAAHLLDGATGESVVSQLLQEDGGADYVAFCHAVASQADASSVLEKASPLIPQEDFSALSERMGETERALSAYGEATLRALPPNQRPAFMRDLQKLVTKTLVLMVAGVVYACIPKVMFWGKVSAAAAISIAAGITATTVLSIYRYYKYSEDSMSQSFQEWIVDVTTDPAASYAVATSMMTVGKTMTNGPVVTGLIIVVFSIYQVMDMVKPMLKKYNFNA